jgi:peptidoglycan/LPS O-acetylase OafA/YrhL
MSRPQDHRLPYMPGIDALRAIAVLAVFFYHANTGGWMPGGFLGVDVFFVISGYLITALLLSEYRRAGHLNVLRFWMRRARRLLPAVAVMIAVTLVLAAIVIPGDVPSLRGDALASLFYVNNWHLIVSDQSYFQEFARPSLFRHLWSLSVEEQFYLLWPLMFAAGMKLFGRQRLLLGVLAGAGLSTLLMMVLFNPGSPDRVFYGTDTRAVGLLLGVALAMVWHPSRLRPITGRGARWILDGVGVLALAMILRTFFEVHDFDPSLYHGGFLLLAFWTALLVGVLAHPAARLGTVLGTPPLVWLGLRSYSFYLWHWPVLMLTRPDIDVPMHGPPLVILQLAATLALADLSYRYVEQPFRQRRGTKAAPAWLGVGRPALAAGVAATVLIVGWSGLVSGGKAPGLHTEVASANPQDQANGGGSGGAGRITLRDPPKVLAIGDSVMAGAADTLRREFGGDAVVDAKEGRQPWDYPAVVQRYRDAGVLPNDVIVQIGNNGPVWYDDLVNLRDALAGVDQVYLVNVEVPRSWEGEVNSELSQFVADDWPQARVIDWHSAAADNTNLTYDQIHLTPSGERLYASLIGQPFK